MLYCNYCDYYKFLRDNNESCAGGNFICEFANFTFPENVEDLNMEYPCSSRPLCAD